MQYSYYPLQRHELVAQAFGVTAGIFWAAEWFEIEEAEDSEAIIQGDKDAVATIGQHVAMIDGHSS